MFVSSVCTRGSVCVVVGRALPLGVCLLAEVSVCLSQGSGLSLASAPPLCFGDGGSGHTQLCSVLMRQMWRAPAVSVSRRGGGGCNLLPR